jgi:5-methyltetrahydropteroyltriglutamate--homocysteine methyltransferase
VLESLADKDILLGVLDLSTNDVESVETIKARVRRGLDHVDAERIILAPDCGMKYLSREAAFGKLTAMVRAARELRAEYGG